MPYYFNVGLLMPIIKDRQKRNNDITNISPITISDTISNLFESFVLFHINKETKDHSHQFGFKRNASCQHAIFALKELLIKNRNNRKVTYICALDFSKAFDKVNRTRMMNKLIGKISGPIKENTQRYFLYSWV